MNNVHLIALGVVLVCHFVLVPVILTIESCEMLKDFVLVYCN